MQKQRNNTDTALALFDPDILDNIRTFSGLPEEMTHAEPMVMPSQALQ
ncbi:MAG: hypothetical protein KJ645_01000 [Planctomycetes bacterium]|nr:hypothetical protein [Planctomycetota bacterium]